MNCLSVRERLLERALGGLPGREVGVVDRHLAWCAACRKEYGELERAAGVVPFALAPASPPAELEDRVVEAVRSLSDGRRAVAPRRGRMTVAATVAAMMAVAGLGWGAVMAGRATRLEQQAAAEARLDDRPLADLSDIIGDLPGTDSVSRLADLLPVGGAEGLGAALTVTSASGTGDDSAIVLVSGLDPQGAPYVVELMSHEGDTLRIGRLRTLDADGGADVQRIFDGDDLSVYERVVVLDRRGELRLQGALTEAPVSPSPGP